jgi:type IV pilus assembly protein PilF
MLSRFFPYFLLSLCISLAGCETFSTRDSAAAELHLQLGTSQLQDGHYPMALATLKEAERLDPDNPVTQNNLGLTYFFRDRFDLSEEKIRKALKLKPDYSDARNNLARVLIERGQFHEAASQAEKVVADLTYTDPDRAYVNLGIAYFKLNRFSESREALLKAIELQRDNCLAHSYFGRSFFEQKEWKRASEALDRAVGHCMKSQYDEPHYYSALAYYQLGLTKKSEARFMELVKIYPDGKYVQKSKDMLEIIRR